MPSGDTIAAIATPPGKGGVGVVRISGPGVRELMPGILGKSIDPRQAALCRFRDSEGRAIDFGLALYFEGPRSFTGEDVLELQGHGGQVVLGMVLARCLELGARLAEPGEFTRRAFLNDKIDLAQAESVADLIDAATTGAARSAIRSLSGEFSKRVHALVDSLIELRMLVEATLDFPEEEIDFLESADAYGKLAAILDRLDGVLDTARQGSLLRSGINIVFAGQPNVGKSSLLNRLSGEEIAIVTDIPGTTRDAIRQSLEIEGFPVHAVDTAGLRESEDPVERIGMARAREAIEKSDLILYLADSAKGIDEEDKKILASLPDLPVQVVFNKADLSGCAFGMLETGEVCISAKTGEGVDALKKRLLELLSLHEPGENQFIARQRHVAALREARDALECAGNSTGIEIFAEELRRAQAALSRITGEFSPDDLLGEIFSRFCIGK
jgi:tRNA modification GTPase